MKKKNNLIFLLIGVILILAAVGSVCYRRSFRATALEATAEIVQIERDRSGEEVSYHVTIAFETADGTVITTQLDHGSSSMEVGDKLTVYYDPENPEKALSQSGGILLVAALGGFGVIFAAIGVSSMAKTKKQDGPEIP